MSLAPPLALTPCLPTELLSYVLQQAHPTTLIICGSRTSFLSFIFEATSFPSRQPPTRQDPDPDPNLESPHPHSSSHSPSSLEENDPRSPPLQTQPQPQQPTRRHPLLTPTLQQISLSRHTATAFIPTVSHLRAYLSVFSDPPKRKHIHEDHEDANTATQNPLLVVYGLLELHRGTSEWSTQGLGNTCAALVEAGRRSGRRVVIIEDRRGAVREEEVAVEGDEEDLGDDGDREEQGEGEPGLGIERAQRDMRGSGNIGIWHEKLPILSGSIRRAGAEVEYGGRTVEVGMVLRRWFKFGRGQWDYS